MAGPVRLSDVVIPEVYNTYQALNTPELTAFWQAGLVEQNALLDGIAQSGGKTAVLPFWKDLDSSEEPDMSNDDPADKATPGKVGTGQMECRKAFMHKSYSSMDLIKELAGAEPIQHIRNRFGTYWARQYQKRLIATTLGVMRSNVAQNASDMTVDISAVGDGIFNGDAVIDAAATMGDALGNFSAIAVHSAVRTRMVKNREIVTIPDNETGVNIQYYKEMRVIVDDSMPVVSGTGVNRVFLSVLIGSGAFGYGGQSGHAFALGEGTPKKPSYVVREEDAGNGGGEEIIGERKTTILHPQGFTWVESGAALAEFSPTNADLALAAHWTRVVDRKQAPFAFLLSKA
jgi:hypothetical protein